MSGLVVFAERFDFRCWKCGETYSIFKEVKLDPEKKQAKNKNCLPLLRRKRNSRFLPIP